MLASAGRGLLPAVILLDVCLLLVDTFSVQVLCRPIDNKGVTRMRQDLLSQKLLAPVFTAALVSAAEGRTARTSRGPVVDPSERCKSQEPPCPPPGVMGPRSSAPVMKSLSYDTVGFCGATEEGANRRACEKPGRQC